MQTRGVARAAVLGAATLGVVASLGCTTMSRPIEQTIRVETPGCAKAICELSNDRGQWLVDGTPGQVKVVTSNAALQVRCRAEGMTMGGDQPATIHGNSGGSVVGGVVGGAATAAAFGTVALTFIPVLGVVAVLSGAVIGMGAGAVVDSTNSTKQYPELIRLPMFCVAMTETEAVRAGGPRFGFRIRGLTTQEAQAAGLGDRTAAIVMRVDVDSAAERAGLRAGDIVTQSANDTVNDATDLERQLGALPPGQFLALAVWRDGRTIELQLPRPREPAARSEPAR